MEVVKKRNPTGTCIVDTVMNIMNIHDIKSLQMNATLLELDMDSLMAAEIKQILERELDVIFTTRDIYSLTLEKLKELSSNKISDTTESKVKLTSGADPINLAMLLKNPANDCSREQKIIRMESKNNSKRYLACVLFIPGLENVAGCAWHEMAKLISIPTYALQLTSKLNTISTIPEIDDALAEKIKMEVFKQTEFFYLVGYSFGAFVTLELARILEESGMSGHVILIDGAPEFLKKLAVKQVGENYNDKSLQLILLAEIIRAIIPGDNVGILNTIKECSTWQSRVEKIVQLTKERSVLSEKCVRQLINSVFNRINISLDIDLEKITPIKSPITLIRPTEVSVIKIDEDYGLRKCTEGRVSLKVIEGNHMTMLENPKLIEIINEMDPFLESNMQFQKYISTKFDE
jgi:fatty acid synthase, animal type